MSHAPLLNFMARGGPALSAIAALPVLTLTLLFWRMIGLRRQMSGENRRLKPGSINGVRGYPAQHSRPHAAGPGDTVPNAGTIDT